MIQLKYILKKYNPSLFAVQAYKIAKEQFIFAKESNRCTSKEYIIMNIIHAVTLVRNRVVQNQMTVKTISNHI